MRIVIFGTGQVYREKKKDLSKDDEIIALLDNNPDKWETKIDDIIVYNPKTIRNLEYDKIILMSKYASYMKKQLLEYGCSKDKIMHLEDYFYLRKKNIIEDYKIFSNEKEYQSTCAIICKSLGYHGGAISAYYCALALQRSGIETTIIAETGDTNIISEMNKDGISVILSSAVSRSQWKLIYWLNKYDYIIVSTIPMILCALEISKYRRVIMWLHDSDSVYEYMDYWHDKIVKEIDSKNLEIYAVSKVAKNNFYKWLTKCKIGILPCGVPKEIHKDSEHTKLIMAIIGSIHPIKGQDILIDTLKQFPELKGDGVEYWIVGKEEDTEYSKKIQKEIQTLSNVIILGEIKKEKMNSLYTKIDIALIPSREETMSLVAIEAMQHGKVCIVSDITGIAEYIKDGENGFVFESENREIFASKIHWCIKNKRAIKSMGEKSLLIYEKYFSMESFEKNLIHILQG